MRTLLKIVVMGQRVVEAIDRLTAEVARLRQALVPELPAIEDEKDVRIVRTANHGYHSKDDGWLGGILNEYSPRQNYWKEK